MKTIYVLLVGINDYPGNISSLNGCLKDLDQIETYLRTTIGQGAEQYIKLQELPIRIYAPLHLCRLENEQATYHQIIHAFRSFLRKAGPDDVVWFHFSGHGSEEFTADEFLALEPNGKDQTLVCYYEKEADGRLFLADKELAVLLHEVTTLDTEGLPKKSPHLVVSLDCCHSGSGTRDFMELADLKTRGFKLPSATENDVLAKKEGNKARPLSSYLEGFYSKQWQSHQKLDVPLARHVLLSACESIQKAGDLPGGGIFTSGLIRALEAANGQLNYADLFIRTRSTTRRLRPDQTPRFETLGNFNPYTRFLDGSTLGNPDRYEVLMEGDQWLVKCGAINGLPLNPGLSIEMEIQTAAPENSPVGIAIVNRIGAQKSAFQLTSGGPLQANLHYQAIIRHLPASPVLVWIHGETFGTNLLKTNWDHSKNIHYQEEAVGADEAQFEVECTANHFHLYERGTGKLIWSRPLDSENAKLIIESMAKIVKWHRTIHLDNPSTTIRNLAEFQLGVRDNQQRQKHFQSKEIRLYINRDNVLFHEPTKSLYTFFSPKLIFKNARQDLFCCFLHLRSNYSIEAPEGEVVFRPAEHPGKVEVELPLLKSPRGWGLSPEENESSSYFKVLLATEELDYQQLLQSGIGKYRVISRKWQAFAIHNDWCSFQIKVTLIRAEAQLSTGAVFAKDKIRVLPHAEVQGRIGWTSIPIDEDSANPVRKFLFFQSPNFRLIHFQSESILPRQQILEFSNLQMSHSEILTEHPIDVLIGESLAPAEVLLPIAFDGQNYRIIGDAEPGKEHTTVHIRALPQVADALNEGPEVIPNPLNPEDQQHRSLYETLKTGFFRLSLDRADLSQFSWVDPTSGPSFKFRKEGITKQITDAESIVLILPDLIAEPKDMAASIQALLEEKGADLFEHTDLILVYDYRYHQDEPQQTLKSLWDENGKELTVYYTVQNGDHRTIFSQYLFV